MPGEQKLKLNTNVALDILICKWRLDAVTVQPLMLTVYLTNSLKFKFNKV